MPAIISVNTADRGGGAERIAWALFDGIRQRGMNSSLLAGDKRTSDPDVYTFHESPHIDYRNYGRLAFRVAHRWRNWYARQRGIEDFDFPFTKYLLSVTGSMPDLVHCHNLHGGYFDLRFLAHLSKKVPVILTLHDCWTFTGHCANPIRCDRWVSGCGRCPDLSLPPAILRDASSQNWQTKKQIYRDSRLYVATPSQWMMQLAERSILAPATHDRRVIPNGVDCGVFRPAAQADARRALGFDESAFLILFVASLTKSNPYKDYATMRRAFEIVARQTPSKNLQFLVVGEAAHEETIGRAVVRHRPFVGGQAELARFYQAADIYLHAARGENSPLSILEAMACGLPVIATAVGGIPEMVEHDLNGILVPGGDAEQMAHAIRVLIDDRERRMRMGKLSASAVRQSHSHDAMIDTYVDWYERILDERSREESACIAA